MFLPLTQKIYDDSISNDFVPTCGSEEQIKIAKAFATGVLKGVRVD